MSDNYNNHDILTYLDGVKMIVGQGNFEDGGARFAFSMFREFPAGQVFFVEGLSEKN